MKNKEFYFKENIKENINAHMCLCISYHHANFS